MAAADAEIEASFDGLTQSELELAIWLDDESAEDASAKRKKKYGREYYKAHRKEKLAYQLKYRAAKLEQCNASHRRYYRENAEHCRLYQQEHRTQNAQKYKSRQQVIRAYRKARGMTLKAFAAPLGVAAGTISSWECGSNPANWTLLQSVYPDLCPNT